MDQILIEKLQIALNTYQSMTAYFYQKIIQSKYKNTQLAQYSVDYSLLLPSSQYLATINSAIASAQIQEYINMCQVIMTYIDSESATASSLFSQQIISQLKNSITQINGFTNSLLASQSDTLFSYAVPHDMSMSEVIFRNNLDIDSYSTQALLNQTVVDFNNLQQNTILILSK